MYNMETVGIAQAARKAGVEAIAGALVYASSDTYWTIPYLDSWDRLDEISFSFENKWFQKL